MVFKKTIKPALWSKGSIAFLISQQFQKTLCSAYLEFKWAGCWASTAGLLEVHFIKASHKVLAFIFIPLFQFKEKKSVKKLEINL